MGPRSPYPFLEATSGVIRRAAMAHVLTPGLTCLGLVIFSGLSVTAQPLPPLPQPGDQFLIHQEAVIEGSYTLNTKPGRFTQQIQVDLGALVVPSATPVGSWKVQYRFDYLRLESQIDGASPTVTEIWPTKLVIDGTPAYDAEFHADAPPPILCHLLLENFTALFSSEGEILRFEERKQMRELYPFIDLVQVLRETWMRRPPQPLRQGLSWLEDRPVRVLSDRIVLPASQTYVLKTVPSSPGQPALMEFGRLLQSTQTRKYPIQVGKSGSPNLQFDALGPDIYSPPPDLRIESFAIQSSGQVEYTLEWCFISKKESRDKIRLALKIPQPDGLQTYPKSLSLNRVTHTTVTRIPLQPISAEAKEILLGG